MTYFDHAATAPVLDEVVAATAAAMRVLGNASALHGAGRAARRLLEESREQVAAALGALPGEIVFTSGGTEADNLAVKGGYWAATTKDPKRNRILVSSIEHHAVLDSAAWLASTQGAVVEEIQVDGDGRLRVDALRHAIERDPETVALVSVMWANNEVGTLQPVDEVVAIARQHGVQVHSDAVQAFGAVPLHFTASGVHVMTVSAHKYGGPSGVGALALQRQLKPVPVLHGGGQERDIRSGTIPVPLIAGMAAAFTAATVDRESKTVATAALRDRLVQGVLGLGVGAVLRGHDTDRLPGNAHFTFDGCDGSMILMLLDAEGIHVSTGSACTAGIPQASHVLLAMGIDDATARGAVRFSLGRDNTADDVDRTLALLPGIVDRARMVGVSA